MKDQTHILLVDFEFDITNSKASLSKKRFQIKSMLLLFFREYLAYFKKIANNMVKNNKKITSDKLSLEKKSLKHNDMNNGKISEKHNSIIDLLFFIVYCGIILSFFILIWNIRLDHWNNLIFYLGIFFTVLVITVILLSLKRR
jgi:hypothetical protein